MRGILIASIVAAALSGVAQSPETQAGTGENKPEASARTTVAEPAQTGGMKQKTPEAYNSDTLIRSDVRRVLLDVSVRDPKGGYVSGLLKDNFHVFEDGKPQQIVEFAAGDIPVTVGLLIDES